MKGIVFSDGAKGDIRSVPQHLAMNILTAIHRLAQSGEGSVRRLQGIDPPEFRLRVGDFRVRFTEANDKLFIQSVKNRKDAYR